MFLPGMRYQDYAWGEVIKVLGETALFAFSKVGCGALLDDERFDENRNEFIAAMVEALFEMEEKDSRRFRARNWLGEDGLILALDLVKALAENHCNFNEVKENGPSSGKYFQRLLKKLSAACKNKGQDYCPPASTLRNIVMQVFSEVRDEVDAHNFRASTGEPMSANHVRNLRTVEECSKSVRKYIENWHAYSDYVGLILGRKLDAEPIEAYQLRRGGRCKPEWLLNWSQHYGKFHPKKKDGSLAIGKFHQANKHFTKSEENIARLLCELDSQAGPYAGLISINVGGIEYQDDILKYVGSNVVEDEEHDSRVLSPPIVEDHVDVTDENEQEFELGIDELDPEMLELMDEIEAVDYASAETESYFGDEISDDPQGFISGPPGNSWMCRSFENRADPDDRFDSLSSCLDPYPLPIRVGLLLRMAQGRDDRLLLEALEHLGVFEEFKLNISLKVLTRAALSRQLGVSPYLYDTKIGEAIDGFLDCCQRRLSEAKAVAAKEIQK